MTRTDLKQILITIAICGITVAFILINNQRINKKIAVVDAIKLFNSFKMKQELESQSGGLLSALGRQADSLKSDLAAKSKVKDFPKAELEKLYVQFRSAQEQLEQTYQQTNQGINEEVWKRLNPMIDEYGKENGFRLIIGANGMGSVLYNDDYYDRTKEVIDFVNKKYEQGN
ncbi:OmpH family outer membrane protein [Taibaiella lutea]|uniref:OmpH family outer membrane protein n=1 Tax=Taibaiella lutea TaxID=2608001 RepID=A0A5M6CAR4_9BACT|nr:OmpH family outer membrane protein [Taibaiella lutea]KAA5532224.1 OmpH family outer membrane protein [Taibaiella lutea]